jgi:hypothetical protein
MHTLQSRLLAGALEEDEEGGWVQQHQLVAAGQVVEMVVRSCSNLLERLHHSYTLYLQTSDSRFVTVDTYIVPLVALLLALLLQVSCCALRQRRGPVADACSAVVVAPPSCALCNTRAAAPASVANDCSDCHPLLCPIRSASSARKQRSADAQALCPVRSTRALAPRHRQAARIAVNRVTINKCTTNHCVVIPSWRQCHPSHCHSSVTAISHFTVHQSPITHYLDQVLHDSGTWPNAQ